MDIILIIIAWRKGWGWKALIPTFLTVCAAYSVVFVVGLIGGIPSDYWWAFVLILLFYIGALIYMVGKPVGMGSLPSYKEIKNLGKETAPKRAISSYGG